MLFFDPKTEFPVLLAPMAGVTDLAFREICRAMGADFSYTEMVSAKGLYYGSDRTASLLAASPQERLYGVQLFGAEPEIVSEMAKRLSEEAPEGLALIDLNMGCPARKITGNGEGSALMRDLPRAARIIEATAKASALPVTVKFRKGYDAEHINAVAFARMAEESGASMVTVHGRTREQMYSGRADWDIIAEVKQVVSIPVIGNGDVFSGADALALRAHTGCDGVMVARGAEGHPFLFAEIKAALSGREYTPPTDAERIDAALAHARRLVECRGGRAVIEMRKHVAWYLSGMRGASTLRAQVNRIGSLAELETMLLQYRESLNS
ncbi:MAG: tRNA dihydrouridine synthase DusB [bacterium]|nr:tRNA dihydrouridine synthase DusB [bacterium]